MARGGRGGRKRTQYVRDNSGRFASTPGGGPSKATPASVRKAAKAAAVKGKGSLAARTSLKRSKAKLATIDKADDTLKTALSKRSQKGAVTRGKKKLAQSVKSSQSKISATPKSGVIKKKRSPTQTKLQPVKNEAPKAAKQKIRPGEFVRANLRPRNVTAKPVKGKNPFQAGKADVDYRISPKNDDKTVRLANANILKSMFESQGFPVKYDSSRASSSVANFNSKTRTMSINRSHPNYIDPAKAGIKSRKQGLFSSSSPMHIFHHEMGHAKDKNLSKRSSFTSEMLGGVPLSLSRRVSRYATTSTSEFVAEAYAGRRTGRKYDFQVMSAYREAKGLNPNPIVRRLKKKGKTKPKA
jgi:hypothetical protein